MNKIAQVFCLLALKALKNTLDKRLERVCLEGKARL
jgi:hypothetical protein